MSETEGLSEDEREKLAPLLTMTGEALAEARESRLASYDLLLVLDELDAQRADRARLETWRVNARIRESEMRDAVTIAESRADAAEARVQVLTKWLKNKHKVALEDADNPCFDTSLRNEARTEAKYLGRVLDHFTALASSQGAGK